MNEWLDLTFSALAARQTCLGLALAWLDRPALRAIVLLACGVGLRGALPSILIYRGKIGFVAGLPRLSSGEASVDQVLYWLLPGSTGELFGRWSSGLWVGLRGVLPSILKLKGFDFLPSRCPADLPRLGSRLARPASSSSHHPLGLWGRLEGCPSVNSHL